MITTFQKYDLENSKGRGKSYATHNLSEVNNFLLY